MSYMKQNIIPAIDVSALLQFDDLQDIEGQDILIETIQLYLLTSNNQILAIQKFLELNEYSQISYTAHSLKSSSQMLGARALGDICQNLENLSSSENEKYRSLVELLISNYANVCNELEVIKSNRKKMFERKMAC